jgi:hypothetical protein
MERGCEGWPSLYYAPHSLSHGTRILVQGQLWGIEQRADAGGRSGSLAG